MARLNVEIVKRSDHTKGFPPEALGGRRMALAKQASRQRLGESHERRSHFCASLQSGSSWKTMQSGIISPDTKCDLGVSGIKNCEVLLANHRA